ncbi:MFS general substrate transporter [Microstroma glucosiphilum]|uniref:MFS general substrate transporter n=1 Tax=Pseudomicrostroma glucosiphilum TaxID=1684307 RepID=A0A316U212_9BASI|nr:MFS general substrate transporter [Pseudomicrostroma glucosiphilum]PWN19317.1 MFS general substrate transporter [Pseudomicrostroma glucosiphilum]
MAAPSHAAHRAPEYLAPALETDSPYDSPTTTLNHSAGSPASVAPPMREERSDDEEEQGEAGELPSNAASSSRPGVRQGLSTSFREPQKVTLTKSRPPPPATRGSAAPGLARRCSAASSRPPSPPFPSMALALSRSTSAAGAQYIEWELDDPEDPFNWSKPKRWGLVICCMLYTGVTALVATAYSAPIDLVTAQFGISSTIYLLGNTTFLVSVAFAPLVLAPFSELVGRKNIFVVSAFVFTMMTIPQALAPNIEGIIIPRIFQGMAGSVGNSITGGIVADLFVSHDRSLPMSFYALIVFVSQGIGPLASAWTVYAHSWRVTFWWQGAVALTSFLSLLIFFSETRGPVLLSRRAARMTKESGGKVQYRCRADDEKHSYTQMIFTSVSRPVLYFFTEPIVTAFSLWVGVLWGTVFLAIVAVPQSFTYAYGWTSEEGSLVLLILAVGGCCGWLLNLIQERWYEQAWKKHNGEPPPETRLYMCAVGALMVPVGLIWFAWGCRTGVHPAVPILGLIFFATGVFPIYMAVFVYLSDLYMRYASSALAAQSALRNILAGTFVLFTPAMYTRLTPQWATSLLALIALLLGSCPFVLLAFGAKIRARSRVAQALKREDEELAEWRAAEAAKVERRNRRREQKEEMMRGFQEKRDEQVSGPMLQSKGEEKVGGSAAPDLEKGLEAEQNKASSQ